MKKNKRLKIKETIKNHIVNNGKEYFLVFLIFIIGIFLGVLFINNVKDNQNTEISSYLTQFIDKLKNTENLDYMQLLKTNILEDIFLAFTIWFFGTTVIRNSHCFWNGCLSRFLLRLYNFGLYFNAWIFKRSIIYAK